MSSVSAPLSCRQTVWASVVPPNIRKNTEGSGNAVCLLSDIEAVLGEEARTLSAFPDLYF